MSERPTIASLLPHRAPAIVLDEIVEVDAKTIACRTCIREDSPFVEGGRMSGVMCIEHMAQAAAAFLGMRALAANEAIRPGLLLGTRGLDLEIDELWVGDVIDIHAEHLWGEGLAATFACTVRRDGHQVAAATLNVMRLADVPA